MSNERLGIFEELQERAERYAHQSEAVRRQIVGAGPAPNGAYAQTTNPFMGLRLRSLRHRKLPPEGGTRRRAIWPEEASLGLNIVQVVQAVILESGMAAVDMVSLSRTRKFSWPRQTAMWAIDRYCPEYSLPEIAYVFRKDHTTVMHAIEATNVRLIAGEPTTRALVANVKQRLWHAANGGG